MCLHKAFEEGGQLLRSAESLSEHEYQPDYEKERRTERSKVDSKPLFETNTNAISFIPAGMIFELDFM